MDTPLADGDAHLPGLFNASDGGMEDDLLLAFAAESVGNLVSFFPDSARELPEYVLGGRVGLGIEGEADGLVDDGAFTVDEERDGASRHRLDGRLVGFALGVDPDERDYIILIVLQAFEHIADGILADGDGLDVGRGVFHVVHEFVALDVRGRHGPAEDDGLVHRDGRKVLDGDAGSDGLRAYGLDAGKDIVVLGLHVEGIVISVLQAGDETGLVPGLDLPCGLVRIGIGDDILRRVPAFLHRPGKLDLGIARNGLQVGNLVAELEVLAHGEVVHLLVPAGDACEDEGRSGEDMGYRSFHIHYLL